MRKCRADLETVCLKCLEKNPARRYASAQDLADDLYRFLDGKPVLARPVGVAQRVWKWARRRPAIAVLLVAFLSLSGTAVGTGIWLRRERCSRQELPAISFWLKSPGRINRRKRKNGKTRPEY